MPDDSELLWSILESNDDKERATLIYEFYRDLDRAERTDKATMYLHIGILAGTVRRLVSE